jgi:tetratricopeptide (TPR) repeat protein
MPTTTDTALSHILELVQAGQKKQALSRLRERVQQQPNNVRALLYLGGLTPDLEEGVAALERVLELEPDNAAAKKGIRALQARQQATELDAATAEPRAETSPHGERWPGSAIVTLAGKVTWPFKDLDRPLADLLDAGDVRQRDLGWAARKAYDPVVKWAAAVRLREKALRDCELSVTEAQAVTWPFKDLDQPMGILLENHTLNLHDLAYAVAEAYEDQVREAAAVLGAEIVQSQVAPEESRARPASERASASTAAQSSASTPTEVSSKSGPASESAYPSDTRGGMLVITGSPYLKQQEQQKRRRVKRLTLLLIGVWLGAFVLSVGAGLMNIFREQNVSPLWSLVALGLLGLLWLCVPRLEQMIRAYDNYQRGRRGELRVAAAFQRVLDDRWILFRNLTLGENGGDLDAVLVGPTGIYALEIKDYRGYNRNVGKRWQRRYFGVWRDLDRNPTRQALHNAQRLHDYLADHNVDIWVNPRIVWAGKSKLWLKKPAVPVWQLTRAQFIAGDLMRGKSFSEEKRDRTIALLKARCVESRAA